VGAGYTKEKQEYKAKEASLDSATNYSNIIIIKKGPVWPIGWVEL